MDNKLLIRTTQHQYNKKGNWYQPAISKVHYSEGDIGFGLVGASIVRVRNLTAGIADLQNSDSFE